jgi:hypothetical protein
MPSRVQLQIAESEERKKRQEKFRKRTRSFFNKARLLAKDTDAWVAVIVRDRSGRIQSFRASDNPQWPPSIKDLIVSRPCQNSMILYTDQDQKRDHPSGTHEFLEKHVVSGFWKEVADDASDSVLEDGGADPFVREIRTASVEIEAVSDSTIKVDQCHVGKEVEASQESPKDKTIETFGPQQWTAVNMRESDSASVVRPKEPKGATLDAPVEPLCTSADADSPSVDPVESAHNAAPNFKRGSDDARVEVGHSDHFTADPIGELKNTPLDALAESDDTIVNVLWNSDITRDVPKEAMAMAVLDTTEFNHTASEQDMIDLNVPGAKSRGEAKGSGGQSADAARVLCTMSQYGGAQSSEGLGDWQLVGWRRMADRGSGQGRGSKSSAGIDPRELLEGWDWVFQRK